MKLKISKDIKIAREKGWKAYENGLPLSTNDYQHFTNKNGAIRLMAQWDVGWKMAELKEKDPDKYNELIKGES